MRKKQLLFLFTLILISVANQTFAQNLLTNGGFEDGTTGWSLRQNNGGAVTLSVISTGSIQGTNHLSADVTALGTNVWDVQSISTSFDVIVDSVYKVSLWAKSAVSGSQIKLVTQETGGEFHSQIITLSDTWTEYYWEFTPEAMTATQLKLQYMNVDNYFLDSIVVFDPTYEDNTTGTAQTITFDPIDDKYTTDSDFDVSATASSGLPVTFSVSSGPATISGNTVSLSGLPGRVTIEATQAGDDTYAVAPAVEQSFYVHGLGINLIQNGGFESGDVIWTNLANDGASAVYSVSTTDSHEGANHLLAQVDVLGSKVWSVQSMSNAFDVKVDTTYKVSFWARSETSGSEVKLVAQTPQNSSSETEFISEVIVLTDVWTEYTWSFTPTKMMETQFKLQYQTVDTYHFDSVFVIDENLVDVTKESQTISFDPISDKYTTDAPFTLSATASSGLAVEFSIVSGPASISGETVTLGGTVGTVTILASQPGNMNYMPATGIEQSFNVLPEGHVSSQTLTMDVKFALDPITIDGTASEEVWSYTTANTCNTYFNDPANNPDYYVNQPSGEDLSADFKLLWTENGIYLYAEIMDDIIHTDATDLTTNGKAHTYDNVEVFFHVPGSDWTEDLKSSGDYTTNTFQLRSNIDAGEFYSGRSIYATGGGLGWVNGTTNTSLDGKYQYAFANITGGQSFEAYYPFDLLFAASSVALPNRLGDLRSISFEFTYGDSDGSGVGGLREGGIAWNSIPNILDQGKGTAATDKTQFGLINLTPDVAASVGNEEVLNLNVYPTIFSDYINFSADGRINEVVLYNSLGAKVFHLKNNSGITQIDQLSYLESGIYFLHMKMKNSVATCKLIKQ